MTASASAWLRMFPVLQFRRLRGLEGPALDLLLNCMVRIGDSCMNSSGSLLDLTWGKTNRDAVEGRSSLLQNVKLVPQISRVFPHSPER